MKLFSALYYDKNVDVFRFCPKGFFEKSEVDLFDTMVNLRDGVTVEFFSLGYQPGICNVKNVGRLGDDECYLITGMTLEKKSAEGLFAPTREPGCLKLIVGREIVEVSSDMNQAPMPCVLIPPGGTFSARYTPFTEGTYRCRLHGYLVRNLLHSDVKKILDRHD